MWFRNLQLFHLTTDFTLRAEDLETRLASDAFTPCGALQPETLGWTPPLGGGSEALAHAAEGRFLLCAKREERILPASVVREEVEEKAARIGREEGRSVGRKERERIRDEVMQSLLPRAFTRSGKVYAYVDPGARWLVVDTASRKRAEELTVLLRKSLGTLPVVPPQTVQAPAAVMTHWLMESPPEEFQPLDTFELREEGDTGAVIRGRRQAVDADEILMHLRAGKRVGNLALQFGERLTAVVGEDLSVKRLRFLEGVMEEAGATENEDKQARMDADFVLMVGELDVFLNRLMQTFGGVADPE